MAGDQPNKDVSASKDQPGKEVPVSEKPETQADIVKFAQEFGDKKAAKEAAKKETDEEGEEEAGDTEEAEETAGKEDKGSTVKPKIKVGEREFTAEEILEFEKSHKNKEDWQKELTQKSQATAEEKKQLAAIAEQFKAYGDLDKYLAAHPEKAKAIAKMLQEGDEPVVDIEDLDPVEGQRKLAQAIKEQRKDLEAKIGDLTLALATKDEEVKLERDITAARAKFPELTNEDELAILGKIEAGSDKSFVELAEEQAGKEKAKKDAIISKYIKDKKAGKVVAGKGGGAPPATSPKEYALGSSEHIKDTAAFLESLNKEGG